MKHILASAALLVRRLHVCTDDAVTDSALTLSLQCALYVSPKCNQTLYDTSRAEDNDLKCT